MCKNSSIFAMQLVLQLLVLHIVAFFQQIQLIFLIYSFITAYIIFGVSIVCLWIFCSNSFISLNHLQQTNRKQYILFLIWCCLFYVNGLVGFIILLCRSLPVFHTYLSVMVLFYLACPIAFFSLKTELFIVNTLGGLLYYQCFNHFKSHQFIDCSVSLLSIVSLSLALPASIISSAYDTYNFKFTLWLLYTCLLLLFLLLTVWTNLYLDKWHHHSLNRDNCFRIQAAFFVLVRILALEGLVHAFIQLLGSSISSAVLWSINISALVFLTPLIVYLPFKRLLLRMQASSQQLHSRILTQYYQYFAFSVFLMFYIFLQLLITLPNLDFQIIPYALLTLVLVLLITLVVNLVFLFLQCCCLKRILEPGEYQTQRTISKILVFLLTPLLFSILLAVLIIFVLFESENQFSLSFNDGISSYLVVHLAAQVYQVPYMVVSFYYIAVQNGTSYYVNTDLFEDIDTQSEIIQQGISPEDMSQYLMTTEGRSDSTLQSCAICLNDLYSSNKKLIRLKKCKHIFHKQCIYEWLKAKGTCPLDRARLKQIQ